MRNWFWHGCGSANITFNKTCHVISSGIGGTNFNGKGRISRAPVMRHIKPRMRMWIWKYLGTLRVLCAFFHAWILLCQVEDFELTSGVDYIILETLDCHDNREFGQMESTCLTEAKKSLIQETYILPIPVPSISYTFCGSRELGNLSAPVDCLRAMSPVFSVKKSKRELAA